MGEDDQRFQLYRIIEQVEADGRQEKEELTVDADSALSAARVQQWYLSYYGYTYPDRAAIEFLSDAPVNGTGCRGKAGGGFGFASDGGNDKLC